VNVKEYQSALEAALEARRGWLDTTQFQKLKDEFRAFHTSFIAIYNQLIQKRLIHEDPYKQEAKAGEIKVPKPVSLDGDKTEQLTICLSEYDNQLDFLINFSQFSTDVLSLDVIKRILALVKYIDWLHFTPDTQSSTTKAVFEVTLSVRTGGDNLAGSIIADALSSLGKTSTEILLILKDATFFDRELFKLELRKNLTGAMQPAEATLENIRKKFGAALPGKPFYPDLAEEVIKEDFGASGEKIRDNILRQLAIPENKPKVIKKQVSFKETLIDGFLIISSVAVALGDITPRLDENNLIIQNRKQSFFEQLKAVFRQMISKEPEQVIYDIEYIDSVKGVPVKESVNFNQFRADLDRKIRLFNTFSRGTGSKLEAMDEKQLLVNLEKAIREAQSAHKILTGLDEYFKAEAPKEAKEKIRGIKPELATIKNAVIKANQKRHEYSAQLEEAEQLKRLGVTAE